MPRLRKRVEEGIKEEAIAWALKHPIDYHWRKHFNIPFGSKEHLNATFLEQQLWYEENKYVEELKDSIEIDADGNVSVKEVVDEKKIAKDADSLMDNLDDL